MIDYPPLLTYLVSLGFISYLDKNIISERIKANSHGPGTNPGISQMPGLFLIDENFAIVSDLLLGFFSYLSTGGMRPDPVQNVADTDSF